MLVVQTGVLQEDFVCLVFFTFKVRCHMKMVHLKFSTYLQQPLFISQRGGGQKYFTLHIFLQLHYFKALLTTQQISCLTVRGGKGGIFVGHPVCVRTVLCVT